MSWNSISSICETFVIKYSGLSVDLNYEHSKPDLGVNGNLKNETLGIVSFRVDEVIVLNNFSSSTLPQVKITIMDATDCGDCGFELLNAPVPKSSSVPVDRVPGSTSKYYSLGN